MRKPKESLNFVLTLFGVVCTCGLLIGQLDPKFFGNFVIEAKIGFGLIGFFFYAAALKK
jgi:hypothetical protein